MAGKVETRDFYGWHDKYQREEDRIILDPDGWNRKNPLCLLEKITYEEFKERASRSTQMSVPR